MSAPRSSLPLQPPFKAVFFVVFQNGKLANLEILRFFSHKGTKDTKAFLIRFIRVIR